MVTLPVATWRIVRFVRASGRFSPYLIPLLILGVLLFEMVLLWRIRQLRRRVKAMKGAGDSAQT